MYFSWLIILFYFHEGHDYANIRASTILKLKGNWRYGKDDPIMELFYYVVFGVLTTIIWFYELNKDQILTSSVFSSFNNNYLVFTISRWLEIGYKDPKFTSFTTSIISTRDILEYSSLHALDHLCCLAWLWLKSLDDKHGHKRACTMYILSCITKNSPEYKVLMIDCILGGIPTSIIFHLLNHDFLLIISRGFWCTMVIVDIFKGKTLRQ